MSDHDSPPPPATTAGDSQTTESTQSDTNAKCQTALQSLSTIVTTATIPPTISLLLSDDSVSAAISSLLLLPDSGAGDNNLCRWLYDTFQSADPSLHLLVLRFVPLIAGLYLSRVPLRQPQAGFEAVLLALYAHETTSRAGQAITVNIPDLSHPSIYHESKNPIKNNSTCLNIAVISSTLDPHGTVRSTRRARIVGVALELYYSKITWMTRESKLNFCESCEKWAGQSGGEGTSRALISEEESSVVAMGGGGRDERDSGRIPLPWELVQPILRILGHCLMGMKGGGDREVAEAASKACQSLYLRSLHDINPKAILATGSLLRLREMALDPKNQVDHTEISSENILSV
ncbi:Hyccin [Hirschfeldia incana]|nr:Hyccin [Hirschfeldia incana]